jgi:hypothetical protein
MPVLEIVILLAVISTMIGIRIILYHREQEGKKNDPCAYGLHQWTQWGEPFKDAQSLFIMSWQRRYCARCNKVDQREI